MKNANAYIYGNLALKVEEPQSSRFEVVEGGLTGSVRMDVSRKVPRVAPAPHYEVASAPKAAPVQSTRLGVMGMFAVVVLAAAFFFAFIGAIRVQASAYAFDANSIASETVEVEPGDSLWSLAEEHEVDGLSTQQVSDYIAEVNDLESSMLRPGQEILVPASAQ